MTFDTAAISVFTRSLLVGVVLLSVVSPGRAQTPLSPSERGKLDGEFQFLLNQEAEAKAVGLEGESGPPSLSSATIPSEQETRYSAIVHTDDPAALHRIGVTPNAVHDGFATARVTREELRILAQTAAVSRVEVSTQLQPHNDEAAREVGARPLSAGAVNGTNYKGQDVLTCIIDTGIDYDHGDFYREDGTTRILSIWDQPDANDSTGTGHPSGFTYGAEYTEAEINAGNVSEEDVNGHGTHVAGTAASSGYELVLDGTQSMQEHRGMAPKSDVVMVKTTFGGAELIDAMSYCDQVGSDEGKPVVINMSLGGHSAPHDGTSTLAQAVDNVTGAGRIVVASAGNEGNQPIHVSGTVAIGNTSTEPWTVGKYTPDTGTSNDYFLTTFWIDGTNDLEIVVTPPSGAYSDTLVATGTGTVTAFRDSTEGAVYIESGIGDVNGDRYFDVQVYDATTSQEPAEGTWTISITNDGGSSTTYHGWTADFDDMPGDFDNGNSAYSVGYPGTATSAITVGSYVHRWRWSTHDDSWHAYSYSSDGRDDISSFSSRGPRRDEVQKPDIAAPGQGMISALSMDSSPPSAYVVQGGKHRLLQGTSMSAPVVAGSVALLLQEDATLTPSDVKTLLTNNAREDSYVTTYGATPNTTFGAGKLDVLGAMTDLLNGSSQREILSYEDPWTNTDSHTVGGSGANKIALQFTPNTDGVVTGALFNLGVAPAYTLTGPLNVEIWSDDGGNPHEKIGSTVQVDTSQLKDFSPTAVNLAPASVDVMAETEYHLVLYPSNASETINIAYETAGSVSGRSQTYDGSSWSGLGNDFVIRPEISLVEGTSTTLPVEIAAFSGTTSGSNVTLSWATASETNNSGFRLQHKAPGASSFVRIGFVQGHGTTENAQTYRYEMEKLSPGRHTFRLRQVDLDGTVHPGPTTTVKVSMETVYTVSPVKPNPVSSTGTIDIALREKQNVRMSLYNVLGQRVRALRNGQFEPMTRHTISIDATELSSGVYFLRIDGEQFQTTRKVTVTR
ncbi:hypothetical protein BSZ35_12470 [Salinibacter sp. 10B]|uniref:S8/S53 family peptidase n=1 Tax=Salinibacter sp. 10B TaxID=1923971 RepID=UPI000CF563F2|nr:S8/S53 family peptidase [Salinibacter sp. 10B]PQJ35308.1 hypothetical protein BSZ35_12470 [Salinibacter sp. 10B]